jgi:N-acetylglucosaminyl-diphospho-decaprenol L-rhamnosyltransferase
MSHAPDLSVIVVSYNTRDLLRECLSSLCLENLSSLPPTTQPFFKRGESEKGFAPPPTGSPRTRGEPNGGGSQKRLRNEHNGGERLEIIVVDNASSDGSAEMVQREFPDVQLIANAANRGFGAAANQGLKQAKGRYLLVLNADVRAMPGALARLVEFMDTHPEAAACGGQLRYPDGRIQPSCASELTLWAVFCEQFFLARLFPRTRLFGGYWRTWWDFNATIEVEQVMGACLCLRRLPNGNPPLFDEDYFLYCEDTDLCYRLRQAGGRIFYVHDAVFVHHLGASGEPMRAAMVRYYNRGKERFFRKFHGRLASGVCWLLNRLGALLRLLIGLLLTLLTLGRVPRFRQYARTFWQVLFPYSQGHDNHAPNS